MGISVNGLLLEEHVKRKVHELHKIIVLKDIHLNVEQLERGGWVGRWVITSNDLLIVQNCSMGKPSESPLYKVHVTTLPDISFNHLQ